MPKQQYYGGTGQETTHSISFDSVTARYVKYEIQEMSDLATLTAAESPESVTISEISLYSYPEISEEAAIYPITARGSAVTADKLNTYENAHSCITLNNTTDAVKSYLLISASYDAEGKLKKVSMDEVEVEAGTARTFSKDVDTASYEDISGVKIMAWETGLKALTRTVELEKK